MDRSRNFQNMKRSRTTSVVTLSRAPKADTRVLLFTLAGGRCEFDKCNRYLLAHHVTHREGNFADMAHIVAFRPQGPRGSEPLIAAYGSPLRLRPGRTPPCGASP
jgi:hypothetical protein